jgi:hypothetical protein
MAGARSLEKLNNLERLQNSLSSLVTKRPHHSIAQQPNK